MKFSNLFFALAMSISFSVIAMDDPKDSGDSGSPSVSLAVSKFPTAGPVSRTISPKTLAGLRFLLGDKSTSKLSPLSSPSVDSLDSKSTSAESSELSIILPDLLKATAGKYDPETGKITGGLYGIAAQPLVTLDDKTGMPILDGLGLPALKNLLLQTLNTPAGLQLMGAKTTLASLASKSEQDLRNSILAFSHIVKNPGLATIIWHESTNPSLALGMGMLRLKQETGSDSKAVTTVAALADSATFLRLAALRLKLSGISSVSRLHEGDSPQETALYLNAFLTALAQMPQAVTKDDGTPGCHINLTGLEQVVAAGNPQLTQSSSSFWSGTLFGSTVGLTTGILGALHYKKLITLLAAGVSLLQGGKS